MKLQVELKHAKNPDICGGYWTEPTDSRKPQMVGVESIEQAAKVCRAYITRNELGGGNWTGGKVYQVNGKKTLVARISYNGRAWDNNDKEIANEPQAV